MSAWLTNRNSNLNTLIARNAGIGTTTPAYTLDVAGVTRSAAVQYQDGSATVTAASTLDYTTFGQNWVQLPPSQVNNTNWQASAVSATGQYQLLGNSAAIIIYSSNYGQTWASASGTGGNIGYIAISASGQYAIMTSTTGVYYSSNYGVTWTASNQNTGNNWGQVCISASGQYAGLTTSTANTTVYYSINYGQTWTASALSTTTAGYNSIAYSASGQYQVAVTAASTSAAIYYSSNYGATWTLSVSTLGSYAAQWSAMSASGQYVTITTSGNGIYYSSNYGVTFTNSTSGLPASILHGVVMSASGQYQILGLFNANCGVYYSSNYGVTWALGFSLGNGYVFTVAMSANAQYMLIPIYGVGGYQSVIRTPSLYTSGLTTLGTNTLSKPDLTGESAIANIVRTSSNTNFGSGIAFGLTANANVNNGFNNYGIIFGGSNGTLSSYLGYLCIDVCNAQNSFIGYGTPSASSIYADTTKILFNILGSNKMTILSSGNVGIGTATPQAPFQVYNGAVSYTTPTIVISDGAADVGGAYGMLNLVRPSAVTDNKSHIAFIRNGSFVTSFGYYQGANTFGWAPTNNMNTTSGIWMVSDGNVGIGITNPSYLFHVSNGGSAAFGAGNGTAGYGNYAGTITAPSSVGKAIGATTVDNYGTVLNINGGNLNTTVRNNSNHAGDISIAAGDMIDSGNSGVDSGIYSGGNIAIRSGRVAVNNSAGNTQTIFGGTLYFQVGSASRNSTSALGGYNTAMVIDSNGNVGIGTVNPTNTLHVYSGSSGGINITNIASTRTYKMGPDTAGAFLIYNENGAGVYMTWGGTRWTENSDERLKKNISTISSALSQINQLRPVTFNYLSDTPDMNVRSGFIAQEVDKVFPKESTWITSLNTGGTYIDKNGETIIPLSVSPTEMIPYLVRSIQELAAENKAQQTQIDQLIQRLAAAGIA